MYENLKLDAVPKRKENIPYFHVFELLHPKRLQLRLSQSPLVVSSAAKDKTCEYLVVTTAVFAARRARRAWGSRGSGPALVILSSERFETLLLRVSVDVCANNKSHDVEEWNPGVLGEEVLGKSQSDGRRDPADFHDGHETSADGRADLVESARAGNDGHGDQVYGVLDRRDLQIPK
jgi:hypothetical protein